MGRIGPPSPAVVFTGGRNRHVSMEEVECKARDIVDRESAIGIGGGGAFYLVNHHRVTVRKVVLTLRGYLDRCIIADVFDLAVKGIPLVQGRLRARIWERGDFHRTAGRLDTPFMGILQASGATDTQLKLGLPVRAD